MTTLQFPASSQIRVTLYEYSLTPSSGLPSSSTSCIEGAMVSLSARVGLLSLVEIKGVVIYESTVEKFSKNQCMTLIGLPPPSLTSREKLCESVARWLLSGRGEGEEISLADGATVSIRMVNTSTLEHPENLQL